METGDLKPWDGPLRGPDAPKDDGHIEHLIRYLLTVHKRFGNTCITTDLQWGAVALHKRDAQKLRIGELEKQIEDAAVLGVRE